MASENTEVCRFLRGVKIKKKSCLKNLLENLLGYHFISFYMGFLVVNGMTGILI